ncbi:MAG: M56 family metallopeptidase [Planctomycetia bacterium]|nr:M56 family metallopeptidase [Planctomycetia bacterium]
MLPDAISLNAGAAGWSTLMIAVLWQSTILAAAVALAAALLRRASPAVRYWLWQIVAAKLLLMPLWAVSLPIAWLPATVEVSRETPNAPPAAETPVPGTQVLSTTSPSDRPWASDVAEPYRRDELASFLKQLSWTVWLMVVWGSIVIGELAVLLRQRARLGRLLMHTRPAGKAIELLVRDCAARVKLARIPRVLVAQKECTPFVCGVWRPVIVLPESLGTVLSDGQLAPVLVHELAHVKRLDLLWNWIPQVARILYFFHPIAHWVAFCIRLEGELACDGWAMAATGQAPGGYADLLVRVVGRLSEPPMLRSGSAASAGLDGHGNVHAQD